MSYLAKVESKISGIPCLIGVMTYANVKPWKGSAHSCPSDLDYYGYCEMEYDVLDRKGYMANWLSKKITDYDIERIEEAVHNHFN